MVEKVLQDVAGKVKAGLEHFGIAWTVKTSEDNFAVLVTEPGWPNNPHGCAGLMSLSLRYGSTGNWLVRLHAFERWQKLTDKNLASLVNDLVEYIRCRP